MCSASRETGGAEVASITNSATALQPTNAGTKGPHWAPITLAPVLQNSVGHVSGTPIQFANISDGPLADVGSCDEVRCNRPCVSINNQSDGLGVSYAGADLVAYCIGDVKLYKTMIFV